MRNIFTTLVVTLGFSIFSLAQTPTIQLASATNTPTQLVQDVLAGPGVQISNVKFNDNANYAGNQIGKFTYTGSQIPFSAGLVMGSGGVSNAAGTALGIIGPNNQGS